MSSYRLLFGLSANPPHEGHRQLLTAVLLALAERGISLVELLIMPVYQRHQTGDIDKGDLSITYEQRVRWSVGLGMAVARSLPTELAQRVTIRVSQLEKQLAEARGGANYTVETLTILHEQYPQTEWLFLLSSDLVAGERPELGRWYQADKLMRLATLVICQRVGYELNYDFLEQLGGHGGSYVVLDELPPLPEISSREIRTRLAGGESAESLVEAGLLPKEVKGLWY